MKRREMDPDWRPVPVTTSIPAKWYYQCVKNGWKFNEIFREGYLNRTEPKSDTHEQVRLLSIQVQALKKQVDARDKFLKQKRLEFDAEML